MLADENTRTIHFGKVVAAGECQPKRRRMIAERVIRFCGLGHQIWIGRNTGVGVLAVITEWPAIKPAILDGGHVIGNEIASQLVALIDRGPQRFGLRFPVHSVGLRKPDAKVRDCLVLRSISRMRARFSSAGSPFSATLLFDPTVA